jgi:hypothetical protein
MKAILATALALAAAAPLAAEPAPDRNSDEAAVIATVEAFMSPSPASSPRSKNETAQTASV